MDLDNDVSANDVANGCLASVVVMVLSTLAMSLIFTELLGWLTADSEKVVSAGIWIAAICLGGYVAARRSRSAGRHAMRTSLWVGVAALFLVIAKLPGPPEGDALDQLWQVLLNPKEHLPSFIRVILTVPAALLGGWLATRTKGK